MKLKYIIPAFMAVIAAVFTGCSDDNDPTFLDEVKVSQSIIGLPADGGSATITVEAAAEWQVAETPDWLTLSALSGAAGKTELTITAQPATESREATLQLTCAGKKQLIKVMQQTEKVELPITPIKNVLEGPDATYRVRGTVVSDPDNQYGNYNLEDETGRIYIYGTFDKKGNKGKYPISGSNGWGFGVGDIVTVEGPRTLYGSTVELVDVTVINIEKSLIKVDSLSNSEPLPIEGGSVSAVITNKGNGISVVIPEEAQSWLSVTGIVTNGSSANVTFTATPNAGGDRSTTVTFKTTDGSQDYSAETTISQKGAILEVPVADFLAAEVGTAQFRLTGIITELYSSDSQGKSFYIQDYSGKVLIYRAEGFIEAGAKVGDIVTVVGQRGAYKDSPQMVSGQFETLNYSVTEVSIAEFLSKDDDKEVYYMVTGEVKDLLGSNGKENDYGNLHITDGENELYVYGCYPGYGATGDARKGFVKAAGIEVGDQLTMIGYKDTYNGLIELCGGIYFKHEKGSTPEPQPTEGGTVDNPFTVEQAIAAAEAGKSEAYVKGIVVEAPASVNEKYGSCTYYIASSASAEGRLQVYSGLYLNKEKFTSADQIKNGDEVIVVGDLKLYNGNPELDKNNWIYSLNGKTE